MTAMDIVQNFALVTCLALTTVGLTQLKNALKRMV